MTEITLCSRSSNLKQIIQLTLELRLVEIEKGIKKTQARLEYFENKYHLSTKEFIEKFNNDEIEHSLDMEFDEWLGETWMLESLNNDINEIKEIQFVD